MENRFSARHIGHGLVLGPIDYSVILNWTYGSARNVSAVPYPESVIYFPYPTLSPLGIISATLVAFFLSSHRAVFKIKDAILFQNVRQGVFVVVLIIISIPILTILAIYRSVVCFLLKMGSSTFISLMDGSDAIWNVKDSSQPIITVLAEIEADGAETLLKAIRDSIMKAILKNPKMTWKRIWSQTGYSYWRTCNDLASLKEHVHWMPQFKQTLENHITSSELQTLISDIAHLGLPEDNSCWEIMVSPQKLFTNHEDSRSVYPVLFRIHHSLGDGISLLQLLLNSLSTSGCDNHQKYSCNSCDLSTLMTKPGNQFHDSDYFRGHDNLMSYKANIGSKFTEHVNTYRKEFQMSQKIRDFCEKSKSSDLIHSQRGITEIIVSGGKFRLEPKRSFIQPPSRTLHFSLFHCKKFISSIGYILQILKKIIYSLNRIRNTCEISLFDAKEISGKKLIAWYTDSPQGHIFSSIKKIKSQVEGVTFSDVFLTALSGSMEKYLSGKNAYIPNCISVVITVFMKQNTNTSAMQSHTSTNRNKEYHSNEMIKLQNSFSVGVLNLPLKNVSKISRSSHLKKVAKHTEFMKKSGQFVFYSFILKWVTHLLPETLLNCLLKQIGHNTMVVSNLVGPANCVYIAGYHLKNLYFWVPHHINTGISVSILSYCNRLQLGLMVDKSIISNAEEVQSLLDETVSQITKLD